MAASLEQCTTAQIPLRARDGSVRAYALIDAADTDFVNQWRWHLTNRYAARGAYGSKGHYVIYLHRTLLGLTLGDGHQGDHINRNKLDCRRANLRVLTKGDNRQNVDSYRGSSSEHRGVSWDKGRNKWEAMVRIGGQTAYREYFEDETIAAEAARSARLRLLPFAVD